MLNWLFGLFQRVFAGVLIIVIVSGLGLVAIG